MSRIFITGSSDGLGLMAARLLMQQGHAVVLHARNINRAEETHHKVPEAQAIVTGDLSSLQQMRSVANQVNALGTFDAIIHNAAVVELGDVVCAAVLSRLHRSRAAENLKSLSQKAGGILAPTVVPGQEHAESELHEDRSSVTA
jgi:NAD(P)-dependent dehydrogenase (short-subunit alcohol dehydrogenase family)